MLLTIPELVKAARQNVRAISADQAKQESENKAAVIVDVREPAEVANKANNAAVNIPRGVLEMQIGQVAANAETAIYLHCATGGRAALAAEQLQRMGYSDVTVITCPIETVCETFGK